ncbi:5'/3'-nucleotidase SurE [Verruconis gallopava]|uniref:5'/3'-nucleotidase SurE n=1 Tax=Verruconis gallopava TaxID=253628 RepID=A0A0D2AWT2_9PEZI|nr:5'/3'-nucleotidase SurE [Verruconis gallopava]KIW03619.1 5'/3'-nucleotidase SurE [Verruconis gallopava]
MHILVTNDDGPPSSKSSPYVLSFVRALQANGHTVSVCLPNTQRSWIGKAHIVGQSIRPSYYRPPPPSTENTLNCDDGHISDKPLPASSQEEEWILVDSTPASCIQIGLFHYFKERGPVDLVVSGPNYGRNTTAVFALSSGTLGGALEAAVCGKRAIALSYAFFDRNHDPKIIAGACKASIRVIEALYKQWDDRVGVYTVNVPLLENAEKREVVWTHMLQNAWTSGSCFTEVEVSSEEDKDANETEQEIRRSESMSSERPAAMMKALQEGSDQGKHLRYTHKHFKWTPKFKDVYDSVEKAGPGNDGWAVKEGQISVTPLQANFMHVPGYSGTFTI